MILFQQKTALWFPACKVPILWANKSILMTAAVHLYSVCVCVCMIAVTPGQVNLLTCLYPCDMLCITHALGASNQLEMWCVTFMRPLSFPSFDPGLSLPAHWRGAGTYSGCVQIKNMTGIQPTLQKASKIQTLLSQKSSKSWAGGIHNVGGTLLSELWGCICLIMYSGAF